MTVFAFTDLDDTLFQTLLKMPDEKKGIFLAAHATNGRHSYMDISQSEQFEWLNQSTRLIPVTARSTGSFDRVLLPFRREKILSNGAVILDSENNTDRDWHAKIKQISAKTSPILQHLKSDVEKLSEQMCRSWIVEELGCPIYFCVKSNGSENALDELEDQLDPSLVSGLSRHRNGNNLMYCPSAISKREAVSYLIERLTCDGDVIWGMGDSVSDLGFMELCHMQVIPTGSQISTKALQDF